mmetsp:Transcript_120657/g.341161  ORF Transcript_120657/g.341161 Transcript_120657/m.341161 type:complete len:205 (+) Transcript_120657:1084-1698(+)
MPVLHALEDSQGDALRELEHGGIVQPLAVQHDVFSAEICLDLLARGHRDQVLDVLLPLLVLQPHPLDGYHERRMLDAAYGMDVALLALRVTKGLVDLLDTAASLGDLRRVHNEHHPFLLLHRAGSKAESVEPPRVVAQRSVEDEVRLLGPEGHLGLRDADTARQVNSSGPGLRSLGLVARVESQALPPQHGVDPAAAPPEPAGV